MTTTKIKIIDDTELRNELDRQYEKSTQVQLCKYALILANHVLEMINFPDLDNEIIKEGFSINEKWQKGHARMHDVRQISFKIHQMAKSSDDIIICTGLRVVAHAVAASHMKEHAMVASDYAVKVINLLYPDNMDEIIKERLWQIHHLKESMQT